MLANGRRRDLSALIGSAWLRRGESKNPRNSCGAAKLVTLSGVGS